MDQEYLSYSSRVDNPIVQTGYDSDGLLRCGICGARMRPTKQEIERGVTMETKLEKHMQRLHDREQRKRLEYARRSKKALSGRAGIRMKKYEAANIGLIRKQRAMLAGAAANRPNNNQLFSILKEEGVRCFSAHNVDQYLIEEAQQWMTRTGQKHREEQRERELDDDDDDSNSNNKNEQPVGVLVVVSQDSDFKPLLKKAANTGFVVVTATPISTHQTASLASVADISLVRQQSLDDDTDIDFTLMAKSITFRGSALVRLKKVFDGGVLSLRQQQEDDSDNGAAAGDGVGEQQQNDDGDDEWFDSDDGFTIESFDDFGFDDPIENRNKQTKSPSVLLNGGVNTIGDDDGTDAVSLGTSADGTHTNNQESTETPQSKSKKEDRRSTKPRKSIEEKREAHRIFKDELWARKRKRKKEVKNLKRIIKVHQRTKRKYKVQMRNKLMTIMKTKGIVGVQFKKKSGEEEKAWWQHVWRCALVLHNMETGRPYERFMRKEKFTDKPLEERYEEFNIDTATKVAKNARRRAREAFIQKEEKDMEQAIRKAAKERGVEFDDDDNIMIVRIRLAEAIMGVPREDSALFFLDKDDDDDDAQKKETDDTEVPETTKIYNEACSRYGLLLRQELYSLGFELAMDQKLKNHWSHWPKRAAVVLHLVREGNGDEYRPYARRALPKKKELHGQREIMGLHTKKRHLKLVRRHLIERDTNNLEQKYQEILRERGLRHDDEHDDDNVTELRLFESLLGIPETESAARKLEEQLQKTATVPSPHW